jgi:4-cresol dehydrogenase (hydroxylating) flavoprotein subunit
MEAQQNCSGQNKAVGGYFFPENREEVIGFIKKARSEKLKVHPVSTGKNWGYGSGLPYDDGAYVLNLSKMNLILDFDPELRTVRIQPGVTQKQLATFLSDNKFDFLVPTTGAGEDVSILGNTLERGYGLTPWADHFLSLTSLEVVLADGSLYRSPFLEMDCPDIASVYKWGKGPYLDGLFSQSSFGIVTEATICLQPRPERISIVFAATSNHKEFIQATREIKELMTSSGSLIVGVNYINSLRTASMMISCPIKAVQEKRALTEAEVEAIQSDLKINKWNIVLTIYGNKELVKIVEKKLKKKLHFLKRRPIVFSDFNLKWVERLFRIFTVLKKSKIYGQFEKINNAYKLFNGHPNNLAHKLTYWRFDLPSLSLAEDIDHTKRGLMWYAPLIPHRQSYIESAVKMIENITRKHGFDPLITLTSNCDRYLVATLALCFSRETKEEVDRAISCYEELCMIGQQIGILPYRSGTLNMSQINYLNSTSLGEKIKSVLDPDGIFDPGRKL